MMEAFFRKAPLVQSPVVGPFFEGPPLTFNFLYTLSIIRGILQAEMLI